MLHKILKDFPGSQDGRFSENFKAGTQVELTPYLAAIVVPLGWAEPVQEKEPTLEAAIQAAAEKLVAGGEYEGQEDMVVTGLVTHYGVDAEAVRGLLNAAVAAVKPGGEAAAVEEAAPVGLWKKKKR